MIGLHETRLQQSAVLLALPDGLFHIHHSSGCTRPQGVALWTNDKEEVPYARGGNKEYCITADPMPLNYER